MWKMVENGDALRKMGTQVQWTFRPMPPLPLDKDSKLMYTILRKVGSSSDPVSLSPRSIMDTVALPDSPTTPGRDAQGRFSKGNPGGPGNPFARQVAQLRQALLDRLTGAKLQAIADKLIDQAKDGNVQATKLLFSYTLGKPS